MRRVPKPSRGTALVTCVGTLLILAAGCSSSSGGSTSPSAAPAASDTSAAPSSSVAPSASSASTTTPATTTTTASGADLSGTWSGKYSGAYLGTFTLHWQQSGSRLSGSITLSAPASTLSLNGRVNGTAISFGTVGSAAITYTGTVSGHSMSGSYRVGGATGGKWSAAKSGV